MKFLSCLEFYLKRFSCQYVLASNAVCWMLICVSDNTWDMSLSHIIQINKLFYHDINCLSIWQPWISLTWPKSFFRKHSCLINDFDNHYIYKLIIINTLMTNLIYLTFLLYNNYYLRSWCPRCREVIFSVSYEAACTATTPHLPHQVTCEGVLEQSLSLTQMTNCFT